MFLYLETLSTSLTRQRAIAAGAGALAHAPRRVALRGCSV
jgi:hypothetical protein